MKTATKQWMGRYTPTGSVVEKWTINGPEPLDPRFDLRNHSPTGFAWGYGGSGPSQLALAILADALGDDEQALDRYQDFKFYIIANLSEDHWVLTREQVTRWVTQGETPNLRKDKNHD